MCPTPLISLLSLCHSQLTQRVEGRLVYYGGRTGSAGTGDKTDILLHTQNRGPQQSHMVSIRIGCQHFKALCPNLGFPPPNNSKSVSVIVRYIKHSSIECIRRKSFLFPILNEKWSDERSQHSLKGIKYEIQTTMNYNDSCQAVFGYN